MWGIERKSAPDGAAADPASDHALNPPAQQHAIPQQLSTGDPNVQVGNVAEHAWTQWRAEIATLGGSSPLLHFRDESRARIDLSSAHPSGMPTFITGERTLLSSLIRDELALRNARLAAGAITNKGVELRSGRGIDAVHLAIGLAAWRNGSEEYLAPVLLRPLAIRRYGRDFELKLRGKPFLNPMLARALDEQFGIRLDADELVALSVAGGTFKPQPVIDRLRAVTAQLAWFTVHPRLVVSTFADVAGRMTADAARLHHPVLDALAGNQSAHQQVESAYSPAQVIGQDSRPAAVDNLLLDADEEQDAIVAQIAGGNSLIVKTLPGAGGTQTIVNALGALIAQNKRVLVASPRRSSLDGIALRLSNVGLGGAAIRPATLRRDLISAITRNEKAEQPHVADVDDALVRLRKVLLDYREALTRKHPSLGVSVLDALEELANLALLSPAPSTTARLDLESLQAIANSRKEAAQTLIKAARLGEFKYGPGDSPWYGAQFQTPADGEAAHELAKKLHSIELPRLIDRASKLVATTKLRPFENISELGVYLRLLADLRETLDRFQPSVFDRPLTELITAVSGRRDTGMNNGDRRRLRKLALEYVRPGVHVADMHESLLKIQQQRTLWNRFAEAGAPPAVPVGIADVQVAYQRVASDLASLDGPLARAGTPASLTVLPLAQLSYQVAGLAAESEVLANLQQRTELVARLREVNLDPLLADLSSRHVDERRIASELELAWWQSVLEHLLANEKALLGGNASVLDRLEADFRLVDDAHASAQGRTLAWQLAEAWRIGVIDNPDEADALKQLLRVDRATPTSLAESAPRLGRALAPVWLVSPYEVGTLPASLDFDAAFIVDAGACSLPENLGVIRRARQVVAFGDPVTQTPAPFETAVAEESVAHEVDVDGLHASSTLARLSELLPVFTLTRSYRAGGDDLAELVNRRFYGGKIEALPWAGTYLGHGSLNLHVVKEGFGLPDPDSGAVESVDSEVAKVVELVTDHAINRPRESLMVITASPRHAVRVNQAVLRVFQQRQDLADFLLADRAEPFTVVTLDQATALSRDRVIFSIGYGRTPHGRLLSNFGPLAVPGGERLLAVGLTRARRSMDLVSCFRPDDVDDTRLPHGVVALSHVLAEAADMDASLPDAPETTEPLLVDLRRRLERRGLSVRLGYRGALPLVASYGGKAVVVETDQIVGQGSLRESLRLRPELLRRLGWHYLRVHSFELFVDPEAIAARVAKLIAPTNVHMQNAERARIAG
ncbi:AAA family ATPase [Gryllotalpicola reticulitermitis]|uniref:AAA family ATPase n=1 Tax=Gryllotalpicola reticulitermitis TaxID=1184153 RepID=A0ABV8Q498_9MICO